MSASAALTVGMLAAGACGMNPGPSPGPDAGGGTGSGSGNLPACGDNHCDPGETAATCPADCRPPGPTCGNHVCEAGETATSCPADCSVCGDSVCQAGETTTSCPQDCTAVLTTKNTSTRIVNHLFVYPCGQTAEGPDQMNGHTIISNASANLTGIPPGCYQFHATSDSGVQWRDTDGVNLIGAEHFTWTLTD